MVSESNTRRSVVVVTGMSGAGRSSALKNLEDLGFEAIDNLPVSLLGRIVWDESESKSSAPLAVGVDIRTRHFHADAFARAIAPLRARVDIDLTLVFMDCDGAVLGQRFTETRRRHPLADDRPVSDGIRLERSMLAPVLQVADFVIDTSQLALPDLRQIIESRFISNASPKLFVSLVSFAYSKGLPRDADLVFDVRFLRNPHYQSNLRDNTGLNDTVAQYIQGDKEFKTFDNILTTMIDNLLPRYQEEGKSYLTIAFGCTGGRHRSVFFAEHLSKNLEKKGQQTLVRHRDLGA